MADESVAASSTTSAPTPSDTLVLRRLAGMRREMATMLERQDRTQQRLVRLDSHRERRFAGTDTAIAEIKSDLVLMENQLLNRHNEILDILRRLDESDLAIPNPDNNDDADEGASARNRTDPSP